MEQSHGSGACVDELYAAVTALGARIVRAPQLYPDYCPNYYAFFFKDTEGVELEIVHWSTSGPGAFTRASQWID